ncbi:arylsulfatase [Seonamhaeicola sp.]|uniref:arylsulfatase n=1 Tax=Seonamhaeicola sp. TaxID=1912245 RepID=UPI002614135D|nr:arylsulfatase [Seonamhaeicola sp.]
MCQYLSLLKAASGLVSFILIILFFSACKNDPNYAEKKQPNIVLIVTDDQAYGDLSFTNNPIVKTPAIDLLAKEGAFAENFYVSPVCAPTRASILTGRYHQRTGVTGVTRGRENMNLDETTLADILKSQGYTTGIFGKWHNGAHYPYHPLGRGFDKFTGFTSGHWTNYFNTTIEKNGKEFKTVGYLTDVLTNEATDFISENNKEEQPFFCYIPYQTPHTPLQVPDKYFDKYKAKGIDDFNASIYGMIENIDDNVEKVIRKLDEFGIRENTIIIFMSDNGPLNFRYNAGLKGKKGGIDEGGVKVPFIINWKGKIYANTTISKPLAHIDILPTLLDLMDIEHSFENNIDGVSFNALLKGENNFPDRKLFTEWNSKKRVRSNDFLLINEALFNLKSDPSQSINIREQFPTIFDSLNNAYNKWYTSVKPTEITKRIPIGYNDYPNTTLPAHEANLHPSFEFRKDRKHTGIAYHSLYGWAHDWIDFWTKPTAYATWDIDVVETGDYEIKLKYALNKENVGVELLVEIDNQRLSISDLEPFEHGSFKNYDRIKRDQEAPEADWNMVSVGKFHLSKGDKTLKIKSAKIPGKKSIELKDIIISRLK